MQYIVKSKSLNEYWVEEGRGITPDKQLAYRYTADELRRHKYAGHLDPSLGVCVLIPVSENSETEK
jgi:hypothetical protein